MKERSGSCTMRPLEACLQTFLIPVVGGHAQSERQHLLMFDLGVINNKQWLFFNHHHPYHPQHAALPVTHNHCLSPTTTAPLIHHRHHTTHNTQPHQSTPTTTSWPAHSDDNMLSSLCVQGSSIAPRPHLLF